MNKAFTIDVESLSPEFKLMLLLIRYDGHIDKQHCQALVQARFDWSKFVSFIEHHRVFPLVYATLRKSNPELIEWLPASLFRQLKAEYTMNTFKMLKLAGEMEILCKELEDDGVQVLMLKGPALSEYLYGDVSLRTSKDLDLLISSDYIEKTEAVLLSNGYVLADKKPRILEDWKWRDHHISYYNAENGIQVEVHWQLSPGAGKEPTFSELWNRRRSIAPKSSVYVLGDEDLFYYLIIHGSRHGWFRLRWLVDIDRMLCKSFHPELLSSTIVEYNEINVAGQALLLSEMLLHSPIDPCFRRFTNLARAALLAEKSMTFICEIVYLCPEPSTKEAARAYKRYMTLLQPLTLYRWLMVARKLLPSSYDAQVLPLPKSLYFLYYPLRPFLWLWRKINQQTTQVQEEATH